MSNLNGFRVAILASDGFEESELTEPLRALRDAGAQVDILSLQQGTIQGYKHLEIAAKIDVDLALAAADVDDYDAVVLPGGTVNADTMRTDTDVQTFLQMMQEQGKPIAAICHAPWELISAGLVRGRTLTSYHTIRDDIRNAGGHYVDDEVVVDRNWVTSRQPDDIPAFNSAMLTLFAKSRTSTTRRSVLSQQQATPPA